MVLSEDGTLRRLRQKTAKTTRKYAVLLYYCFYCLLRRRRLVVALPRSLLLRAACTQIQMYSKTPILSTFTSHCSEWSEKPEGQCSTVTGQLASEFLWLICKYMLDQSDVDQRISNEFSHFFVSWHNTRPFNLHLDFWKSRSWEIKVLQTRIFSRSPPRNKKLDFYQTWKKSRWQTEKKSRCAGPEIFLRFESDLNFSRPWFSEIKVQIKRTRVGAACNQMLSPISSSEI